ncbi:MAG TPA: adenylate/guanylate cyclase domain-containing protein [Coleofasciculaceae cyanobacterium]
MGRFNPTTVSALLVTALAFLGGLGSSLELAILRSLDLQAQSLFFQLRGPVTPPDSIVILAIDDDSLARGPDARELPELAPIASWPWRRSAYATAIDHVMAAGARAVAVDLVFDLPGDKSADQALQATLRRHAGKVTLAAFYATSQTVGGGLDQLILPDPMFRTKPKLIGIINYVTEANGQFRRFTDVYLERIDSELRQSQGGLVSFDQASLIAANQPFSKPKGEYIHFYGGQNTFSTVSFWRVLHLPSLEVLARQGVFRDKLVLIGPTAGILQDLHLTPFGELSGVEIHANAIATLLQGRSLAAFPTTPHWRGFFVFAGILSVGLGISFVARRPTSRSLITLGATIAWVGLGYLAFISGGWILPIVVPAGMLGLVSLSYLVTGFVSEQREKLQLRRTLDQYVAAPVVREILSQPADFQALLQGRKLQAAVLFCDIRGFTKLSYNLPAEQLVAKLNTYLKAMVEAIIDNRGTMDKFIGDAIMAEFGSPVSQGEKLDALNAIRAALAMRRSLAALREQWRHSDQILLYHGIGISFGEVIAGNIGSLKRLEFTVIGDAVNVASRVEGLTKSFQTDILITGPLYDLVQDKIDALYLGEYPLRGRENSPARLYRLIGLSQDDRTLYEQVQSELRQHLESA